MRSLALLCLIVASGVSFAAERVVLFEEYTSIT